MNTEDTIIQGKDTESPGYWVSRVSDEIQGRWTRYQSVEAVTDPSQWPCGWRSLTSESTTMKHRFFLVFHPRQVVRQCSWVERELCHFWLDVWIPLLYPLSCPSIMAGVLASKISCKSFLPRLPRPARITVNSGTHDLQTLLESGAEQSSLGLSSIHQLSIPLVPALQATAGFRTQRT